MWSVPVWLLIATVITKSMANGATVTRVGLKECRNGKRVCVAMDDCQVRVTYSAEDGCPSDKTECCPKENVLIDYYILPNTKLTSATTHATKPREAPRFEHNAPWLATIFDGNRRHCCHGALISNRFVLTASICWFKCRYQPNFWTVRVGLRHSNSPNSSIDVKVQNGTKHNAFNFRNRANNIAVLQLNQAISFSQHIQPISRPTEQESIDYIDGNLLYTGWNGSFAPTSASNEQPDILKMIELKQINGTYCRQTILANQKGTSLPNDKYFCVMSNNASETCDPNSSRCIVEDHKLLYAGNTGGPVVAKIPDNRYVLYGIISRCYDNTKAHVPTLVTNVVDYKSWIDEKVNITKNNQSNG